MLSSVRMISLHILTECVGDNRNTIVSVHVAGLPITKGLGDKRLALVLEGPVEQTSQAVPMP